MPGQFLHPKAIRTRVLLIMLAVQVEFGVSFSIGTADRCYVASIQLANSGTLAREQALEEDEAIIREVAMVKPTGSSVSCRVFGLKNLVSRARPLVNYMAMK